MKNRIYYLCVAVVAALLLYSCKPEPEPPKNIDDLGPIETREGEDYIPHSYRWTERQSFYVDGERYSVYPSGDLNIKGEKGVDYRYFVGSTTNIEAYPIKVFDILTEMDVDPAVLIEQFLKDPEQVGHDFKGTIVVSLPHTLEVEQAKIYDDGVAIDYGYGFQIRRDIEEHGLVTSEQKDVIELRNYAYCSDFYLVIYELDTGNIISYTFLYSICHGTGPGSEGGSSGSSNNSDDDIDWGIHDDDGTEECSWVHTLGYYTQQRTFWDWLSSISLFPDPIDNTVHIPPIHMGNLGGFCKLVGVTTYAGGCSWQNNVVVQNGTQGASCLCLETSNVAGTAYRFGPKTVRITYNGNAANTCSNNLSLALGGGAFGISFDLNFSSNDVTFFNETFTEVYGKDSICWYDCEG